MSTDPLHKSHQVHHYHQCPRFLDGKTGIFSHLITIKWQKSSWILINHHKKHATHAVMIESSYLILQTAVFKKQHQHIVFHSWKRLPIFADFLSMWKSRLKAQSWPWKPQDDWALLRKRKTHVTQSKGQEQLLIWGQSVFANQHSCVWQQTIKWQEEITRDANKLKDLAAIFALISRIIQGYEWAICISKTHIITQLV